VSRVEIERANETEGALGLTMYKREIGPSVEKENPSHVAEG
jgi:hypothetical protein